MATASLAGSEERVQALRPGDCITLGPKCSRPSLTRVGSPPCRGWPPACWHSSYSPGAASLWTPSPRGQTQPDSLSRRAPSCPPCGTDFRRRPAARASSSHPPALTGLVGLSFHVESSLDTSSSGFILTSLAKEISSRRTRWKRPYEQTSFFHWFKILE